MIKMKVVDLSSNIKFDVEKKRNQDLCQRFREEKQKFGDKNRELIQNI